VIGTTASPTNVFNQFTFAAPGLSAPLVTPPPNGSLRTFDVSANPGTSTDPANSFFGFGLAFINPPCLDASRYTGVQFTITGDLGTCAIALSLVPSQNNSVAFSSFGSCPAGAGCFGPFSGPLTAGTNVVRFSDISGGSPLDSLDPTDLNDIVWNMNVPTDGITAPCVASFTISDVSFVSF